MPVATPIATTKVLGILDVALSLDPVQQQTRAITLQTILSTVAAVIIGAAFVILFTRRFVATPIQRSDRGDESPERHATWTAHPCHPPQPGTG